MKNPILVLLFLLFASPTWATITRVQSKTATTGASSGTSTTIVLDAAPTNGNLLVLATAAANSNNANTIASDANITWVGITVEGGSSTEVCLFYGYVRTASASATITISNVSSVGIATVCAEYSGFTNPVVDRAINATGTSTSPSTGTSSTTRSAAELWVAGISARGVNGNTLSSPTNSFAIVGQTATTIGGTGDRQVAILEKIVAATGTANAGATITSGVWCAQLFTFDEAGASGGLFVQ